MNTIELLSLTSGIFWTIAYIAIIRQSFKDRVYAMPFLAMCMNIAWEFVFSFIYPDKSSLQHGINITWFVFDLAIVFSYLRFWKSDFPKNLSSSFMLPNLTLTLVLSVCFMLAFIHQFPTDASAYTAFGDNLIMSVLFVSMLLRRGSRVGQSMFIAITKLLGTAAASVTFYLLIPSNMVLNLLYVSILIFDVIYVAMLMRMPKSGKLIRYGHSS
jgi:hypothetical protein